MKRALLCVTLLSLIIVATVIGGVSGPVAIDWHNGGNLCVLYKPGVVLVIDLARRLRINTIPIPTGLQPVEIVSARLQEREYVFVSGFLGRTGTIYQYDAKGKLLNRYETPEQAASFDIDPSKGSSRRLIYAASPVNNAVYAINLDQKGAFPKTVTYIKEAAAIGPVIFDQGRNRLIVGDTAQGGGLYEIDCATGAYRQTIPALPGRPISFAFDATFKTLYIAEAATGRIEVLKLDGSGMFRQTETIPTDLRNLSGLSLGPSDTLFLADSYRGLYQLSLRTRKATAFTVLNLN
jgi:DNA-binding beta-propeller fold protein YncE